MTDGTTSNAVGTISGEFHVVNGQIVAPNGSNFIAKGINVEDWAAVGNGGVGSIGNGTNQGTLIPQLFPGVNFIRLDAKYGSGGTVALDPGSNYYNDSPAALATFIQNMTSHGIVVEIEDHNTSNNVLTGAARQNELQWYKDMASYYSNNPDVWFGTINEPWGNPTSAVLQQEQDIYSAIRSTGNNNMVLMEISNPPDAWTTNWNNQGSYFANMTNVAWDVHLYDMGGTTVQTQTQVNADVASALAAVQTGTNIKSADGVMPVIVGEYGPSMTGSGTDVNGTATVAGVEQSGFGSAAWSWGGTASDTLQNDGVLTSYGQQVANWMKTASPPSTPASTPSANDAVVIAGSTLTITDGGGNVWSISNGVVEQNGAPAGYSANVTEITYVGGAIWQKNTSGLWWQWGSTGWLGAGTATSPLPQVSANDTVLVATSSGAISDATGNVWSLSNGVVQQNGAPAGYSANVTEIAYVNGAIWQENTSGLWWQWGSTGWLGVGTSTSPLPGIKVTASGTTASVDATKAGTITADNDTFLLTSPGNAKVTLGAMATTLQFTNMSSIALTGGTASAIVSADAGTNTFTSSKGALEVAGGKGADAYIYYTGSGRLTIDDLSFAKGDTLTIDSSLKASMKNTSDGHGGTLLSFGAAGSIELENVTAVPAANLHWQ